MRILSILINSSTRNLKTSVSSFDGKIWNFVQLKTIYFSSDDERGDPHWMYNWYLRILNDVNVFFQGFSSNLLTILEWWIRKPLVDWPFKKIIVFQCLFNLTPLLFPLILPRHLTLYFTTYSLYLERYVNKF